MCGLVAFLLRFMFVSLIGCPNGLGEVYSSAVPIPCSTRKSSLLIQPCSHTARPIGQINRTFCDRIEPIFRNSMHAHRPAASLHIHGCRRLPSLQCREETSERNCIENYIADTERVELLGDSHLELGESVRTNMVVVWRCSREQRSFSPSKKVEPVVWGQWTERL